MNAELELTTSGCVNNVRVVNGINRKVPIPGYTTGLFVENVQVAELAGADMTMLL